jgi:hypothetical protein
MALQSHVKLPLMPQALCEELLLPQHRLQLADSGRSLAQYLTQSDQRARRSRGCLQDLQVLLCQQALAGPRWQPAVARACSGTWPAASWASWACWERCGRAKVLAGPGVAVVGGCCRMTAGRMLAALQKLAIVMLSAKVGVTIQAAVLAPPLARATRCLLQCR